MTDRQHIESYMRTRTRTLQTTDWYAAGHKAGTAPTEWEMIEYGRTTALGWLGTSSGSMERAISRGFAAIYDYAYNDIRDTIRRTAGTRGAVAATSSTEIHEVTVTATDTPLYDMLDWITRAPLTDDQRRIVHEALVLRVRLRQRSVHHVNLVGNGFKFEVARRKLPCERRMGQADADDEYRDPSHRRIYHLIDITH